MGRALTRRIRLHGQSLTSQITTEKEAELTQTSGRSARRIDPHDRMSQGLCQPMEANHGERKGEEVSRKHSHLHPDVEVTVRGGHGRKGVTRE